MLATSSTARAEPTRWRSARRELRRYTRLARLLTHLLIGGAVAGLLPMLRARRGSLAADRVVHWWNRQLLAIINLRLRIIGDIAGEATLYVCNHISWLDIPCLRAVINATFVSKEEVRGWPIFGRMAAHAGTIFIARGDPETTTAAADAMTWLLTQRRSVTMFPEGTTTSGDEVQRFYPRLYQAAIRTRAQVQAVAITYPHVDGVHPATPFVGDDMLAPHVWRLLAEDTLVAQLTFCTPLPAANYARRELAEATRAQIADALYLRDEPTQVTELANVAGL
ncbi:MAG: 1-acyl-sn-glycerol-3-phosphate acyltransferase [Gammaproteobacteria bacterium]|nr:1-acyl-sn-glycerol-3-phosphate acyltransferase [Gammaproteobacteria bacterium]